jgi:hypothetical protein
VCPWSRKTIGFVSARMIDAVGLAGALGENCADGD